MNNRCIGCGILLQDKDSQMDGYVSNSDHRLCCRCFRIKNYGENHSVATTNDDYFRILSSIGSDDLVVYVSSLLTLNVDYVKKFKNVLLVLTKRDILPKSVKDVKIMQYVSREYGIKDVILVSAFKKFHLDELYNKLLQLGKNRKIYFVGSTNSGKSTLINMLIKSYNGCEGEITTSNFPSTTLGKIDVSVGDLHIIDTPGIVSEDSLLSKMDTKMIKKINSKKEIKPITFQVSGKGSILLDELCRIDYETDRSSMTFYLSNLMQVDRISLTHNDRMLDYKSSTYTVGDNQDLVIENVGFIKITNGMNIRIYYKDSINIRIRNNLI